MKKAAQQINTEFLKSKSFSCLNAWGGGKQKVECTASFGNIKRISDNVFRFTEYNFMPTSHDGKTYAKEDILEGHFTFYVNANTFEYLAYKSSDYGSFTYVSPVEFNGFYTKETLPEISRKRIESVIAHKLLGAYFQDGNAVNRKGANLFSNGIFEYVVKDLISRRYEVANCVPVNEADFKGKKRYFDGPKRSLICDYRGYIWCDYKVETLCEADLLALKTLEGWTQPGLPKFPEDLLKSLKSKLTRKKGEIHQVDFEYAGLSLRIAHRIDPIFGNASLLSTSENVQISQLTTNHSLTRFIRLIPEIIRNYSSNNLK